MLPSAEADIVRRDPRLPGLATVLAPETFADALRGVSAGIDVADPQLTYVRYKPGRRCLVSYRLLCNNRPIEVYAKALDEHGWRKHAPLTMQLHNARHWQGLPALLERIAVVVYVFPVDYCLRGQAGFADSDARRRFLERLFPERDEYWEAGASALRYKPERRFVARLDSGEQPLGVVKLYDKRTFPRSLQNARQAMSLDAGPLACRMASSRRHRAIAFPWIRGIPLDAAIRAGTATDTDLVRVGLQLAAFHSQQNIDFPLGNPEEDANRLRHLADDVGFFLPSQRERVVNLARQIVSLLDIASPRRDPIHGDFYAKQILIHEKHIGLVDLDEAKLGDPREDLGNFIAQLEREVIRRTVDTTRAVQLRDAFLDGYCRETSSEFVDQTNPWAAAALLRLATHPFRDGQLDWPDQTAALLDRTDQLLAKGHARTHANRNVPRGEAVRPLAYDGPPRPSNEEIAQIRRPRRAAVQDRPRDLAAPEVANDGGETPRRANRAFDPSHLRDDAKLACVAPALDLSEANAAFRRHLPWLEQRLGHYRVAAIEVIRHKPGRRCLISYRLRPSGANGPDMVILGKARAKGLDDRTFEFQSALWLDAFAEDSRDGMSVPRPIGVIPEWRMWLQQLVPGTPATSLCRPTADVAVLRPMADAIFKLHRTDHAVSRRHTVQDELNILRRGLDSVARDRPEWHSRIRRLYSACEQVAAILNGTELCLVHRDFYPDQVVVSKSRRYLVDLDLHCMSDPALDVGNFSGHLVEHGLRVHGRADACARLVAGFERRYVQLAGQEVMPRIEAYRILTLTRHIYISTLFSERRWMTERLMHLCQRELGIR